MVVENKHNVDGGSTTARPLSMAAAVTADGESLCYSLVSVGSMSRKMNCDNSSSNDNNNKQDSSSNDKTTSQQEQQVVHDTVRTDDEAVTTTKSVTSRASTIAQQRCDSRAKFMSEALSDMSQAGGGDRSTKLRDVPGVSSNRSRGTNCSYRSKSSRLESNTNRSISGRSRGTATTTPSRLAKRTSNNTTSNSAVSRQRGSSTLPSVPIEISVGNNKKDIGKHHHHNSSTSAKLHLPNSPRSVHKSCNNNNNETVSTAEEGSSCRFGESSSSAQPEEQRCLSPTSKKSSTTGASQINLLPPSTTLVQSKTTDGDHKDTFSPDWETGFGGKIAGRGSLGVFSTNLPVSTYQTESFFNNHNKMSNKDNHTSTNKLQLLALDKSMHSLFDESVTAYSCSMNGATTVRSTANDTTISHNNNNDDGNSQTFNDQFTVIEDEESLPTVLPPREIRSSVVILPHHTTHATKHQAPSTKALESTNTHNNLKQKSMSFVLNKPRNDEAALDQSNQSSRQHDDFNPGGPDFIYYRHATTGKGCVEGTAARRRFICILAVVSLVGLGAVVAAVVIGVLFSQALSSNPSGNANSNAVNSGLSSGGGSNTNGDDSNSGNPIVLVGTTRYEQIYNRLLTITPNEVLEYPSSSGMKTAQRHAMEWIIQSDPAQVDASHPMLLQRYALTTLFYSAGGTLWYADGNWLSHENLCTWVRVNCEIRSGDVAVTGLTLNHMNLNGFIPDEIAFGIPTLEEIDFSSNNLRGTIPTSFANLRNLGSLNLSYNSQMSGSISLDKISSGWKDSMRLLHLNNCNFSGPISNALSNLSSLQEFHIQGNQMNGNLPNNICTSGTLRQLYSLNMGNNQLGGALSKNLGSCVALKVLRLQSNNFSGTIPETLGNLSQLQVLRLENNQFSGPVPQRICDLKAGTFRETEVVCSIPCSCCQDTGCPNR